VAVPTPTLPATPPSPRADAELLLRTLTTAALSSSSSLPLVATLDNRSRSLVRSSSPRSRRSSPSSPERSPVCSSRWTMPSLSTSSRTSPLSRPRSTRLLASTRSTSRPRVVRRARRRLRRPRLKPSLQLSRNVMSMISLCHHTPYYRASFRRPVSIRRRS
ncbi:hypothetical protein CTA2_7376, partial [Colletotrichum tanaceti]